MKKIIVTLLACWAAFQVVAAEKTGWETDLAKAQAQAKKENKLVLLDFTGSDWCGWCIKLDHETFSKPEWAAYAKKNLVLVEVDFPRSKELSDAVKKQNEALQKKYKVEGFPTIVVIDANGKTVWTKEGYLGGGPKAMIDEIEKSKKKA
ncbi:MAG: trxA [Verrucomicrobiales bacterium]|nr:trxA [Verrucomicrobiales bacterium]